MFIMIIGITIIFLTVLLALGVLIIGFPIVFQFVDNKILDALFIKKDMGEKGYKDFGYALINFGEEELMIMKNYVIYAVNGVLIALLIAASILAVCQLMKAKNKYFSTKIFATNFFIITISIVLLSLAVVFTGQWWLIVVMGLLAIGLGLLQIAYFVTIKDNTDQKNSAKLSEVERKINISAKKISDIEDKVTESVAKIDTVQKNVDELELDQILDSSFTTEVKEIHENLKNDYPLTPEQPIFDFQEINEDNSSLDSNVLNNIDEDIKNNETLNIEEDINLEEINEEKKPIEEDVQDVIIQKNVDDEIDEENNDFEQIENLDEYDEISTKEFSNEQSSEKINLDDIQDDIEDNIINATDNIYTDVESIQESNDIKPSEIENISDLNKYNQNNQLETDLSTWLTDNIDDNIPMVDDNFNSETTEYEMGSTTSLIQEINEHRRLKQKNLDEHNSWEQILNQDQIVGGETKMSNVKNPFDNLNGDSNQKDLLMVDDKEIVINPDQVYYHSPISGKTIEIDSNRTQEVLFNDELYEEEIYTSPSPKENPTVSNYSEDIYSNSTINTEQNVGQENPIKEEARYSETQYTDATVTEQLNSQNVNQGLYENYSKNTNTYSWSANDPNLSYQTDLYGAVSGAIDEDPLINLTDELLSVGVNYFNDDEQQQVQVASSDRHRHINVDQGLANQTHIFVNSCPICQSNRLK